MRNILMALLCTVITSASMCQMIDGELRVNRQGVVYVKGQSWLVCDDKTCPIRAKIMRTIEERPVYVHDVAKDRK